MSLYEDVTLGKCTFTGDIKSGVTHLQKDKDNRTILATGTTLPDAVSGYAKGCVFIKTNAASGDQAYYENIGTTSSCLFDIVGRTYYKTVSLTNANMLNLRATPITLVAAPGAGKFLEFVSAQLIFDYTAAYTESADNMAIKYTDGSGDALSQTIEATGFVDATADTITNVLPKIDAIVAASASVNKALVLHNTGDGEYGGGNAANVVTVKVAYRVHVSGL